MNRRLFLGWLSLPALAMLTGGATAQAVGLGDDEYTSMPVWTGKADARPNPPENLRGRIGYLAIDTGAFSYIDEPNGTWTELPTTLPTVATADLPDPTTVPMGYMVLDGDRLVPAWNDGEAFEWPTFVDNDDVLDTPVTVTNQSAETEVYRFQLGKNAMVKGRKFTLELSGKYNTENSSSSCRIRVYTGPEGFTVGGGSESLLADITTVEESVTDGPWNVDIRLTVRSVGQTGELGNHAKATFNNNPSDDHQDAVTVDTTAASGFAVTFEWGADASTGNSMTLGQASPEQAA